MPTIDATPDDVTIKPRNVMFARDKQASRWWNGGNPVATAFFNSMSLTFPRGEAFFIDSVRHFRDSVPATLQSQIDAFTKQEAAHSREHGHFNDQVKKAGYDITLMESELAERIADMNKAAPIVRLVTTAALEHFTAIIAHACLKSDRHLKGADQDAARLWQWHAIEEIEHKGVAYDTFLAATRNLSTYKRWKFRSLVMLSVSIAFVRARLRAMGRFFDQDRINTPTIWLRTFWYLAIYPGMLRQLIPSWLAFFRPNFHPWQHDDRHLIDKHLGDLGLPASGTEAVIKLS
jgi:predicted metal-dependent hydrolase